MNTQTVFVGIGVLAIFSNIVTWILIMAALDRRGYKTSILWARLLIFKYLSAYKEATRRETGKTGMLFHLWIVTINVAAVGFLVAVFMH